MKSTKSLNKVLASIAFSVFSVTAIAGERDLQFQTSCDSQEPVAAISFVGDILVHDAIYKSVVSGSKNFSQIWQRTNGLMTKADFSVANLEGPAALGVDRQGRDRGDIGFVYDCNVYCGTDFSFNYHPRILQNLKDSGYDLLTMANNHAMDRNTLGVDKSVLAAANIGMPVVGIRHSSDRNGEFFKIAEINGIRVAFLGCTESTNGHKDRFGQVLNCYSQNNEVENTIRSLSQRSDVDAVILMPHWGSEYEPNPGSRQRQYARRFLDAGATAIIGSHPHVLQPWEKYTTRDGRETLIAYSLGNFVAYQRDIDKKTGAVVYLGLQKNSRGEARVVGAAYTPTYRDGVTVYSVSGTSNRSALSHAQGHFGTARRIEPTNSELKSFLCRK